MKFYNGMKRDTARIDQPQDSYRRARNIILDHTLAAAKSEGGLVDLEPNDRGLGDTYDFADYPGIQVCGIIPLPQDQHLYIMRTAVGDNHLVHVRNNIYSRIENIEDGPYTPENPIKGVAYERPSGDYVVVWTDGVNNPVYIIIDDPDTQISATLYPLFPTPTFPNCIGRRKNWATSGSIGVGTYSFFIAYEIDDNNITPFSPSYGTFKIGVGSDDRLVKAQIEFRLENLDTSYNNYRIYGIRNLNETLSSFYIKTQSTQESIVTWSGEITNYDISVNALTIPSAWYETAETLTVADDRLYLANLTTVNFDGSSIAENVNLHWSIQSSSRYENAPTYIDSKELQWTAQYRQINIAAIDRDQVSALPDHYGTSMGFMPGCAYAFYIAFLLKDGNWTQAYPIPGTQGDATIASLVDIGGGDLDWPRVNTTGERYMGDLGGMQNLSGDIVHTMPTAGQVAQVWGDQATSTYSPLPSTNHYDQRFAATDIGVIATNIVIPEADRELIQGYSIFYAKPTANTRTVLAYTPELEAQYHIINADGTHDTTDNGYAVRDAYLNDLQPDLTGCRRKYIFANQGVGTDGYDMSTATDGTVGNFQYEYLPGNTNGLIYSTDNREGKLIVDDDAVHPTLDPAIVPPDAFGLENSGEEVWGWSWLDDYNTYSDWIRATPRLLYALERPAPPEFYNDLDNQLLVRCSYIEQDLTKTDMDRVSWGGDTVASPMRYRYIRARRVHTMTSSTVPSIIIDWDGYSTFGGTTLAGATGGEWQGGDPFTTGTHINFLTPEIFSYMTYQYVIQGNEDMSNPNLLLQEQIDIFAANNLDYWTGSDQFNETYTRYVGSPEEANVYSNPRHLFQLNDHKSAFPSSRGEFIYRYPNRIARSSKQNYESDTVQWSQFAPGDRYDNALNKGPIQNIAEYAGEIIIHHTDSIFKTLGKETLDTSASAVFVGSGDLFRAAPAELIPTEEGYAGIIKHTDAMVCKSGYVFVDGIAGKVFQLSSTLSELSQKGMRLYFRNTFNHTGPNNYSPYAGNGYALGYDPVYDRIILTAHDGNTYETISYSALNDCWASNHTYSMYGFSTDRASIFGWNGTTLARIDVDGAASNGCYIELISNEGGSISKVFQNFEWVTKLRNVDEDSVGNWQQGTFDSAFVYNDTGLSANTNIVGNARFVEEVWRFNDFRNMTDAPEEWFDENGNVIATINMAKPWYQQQRIRGGYAGIRLILLPTEENVLYLTEVTAKYRISYR